MVSLKTIMLRIAKEEKMSSEAPMYIYATENVGVYYSLFKIKGKKVLTVCGSGDQVLNAYYLGAREVVGFDLNKRSEFILRLKAAAIKKLEYKEFLKFFGENNIGKVFDFRVYMGFRDGLDKKTRNFFDSAYEKFKSDGNRLARSEYFRQRKGIVSGIKKINCYLASEESYIKMRNILCSANLRFIHSNIQSIGKKAGGKFDLINLSNVPNYFVRSLELKEVDDPFGEFYENTLKRLNKALARRGIIISYSYSSQVYRNSFSAKEPLASRIKSLDRLKNSEFRAEKIKIPGIRARTLDRLIILRRK